ncbi:MAG: glycosyltransferase family 2 protein [Betaproteobacteria bacterium]
MQTTSAPAQPLLSALAIAMVKNEADIIEASIRHNLAFVDMMVVIDNASTDGTLAILEALRREGLPLLIIGDPVFGHFQSEKVTQAYRMVAPVFNPELVYLLDADEFVRAPSRAALNASLARLPLGSVAVLPWETHVPLPDVTPEQVLADPLATMPMRRRREEPVYYKAVLRRDPADDGRMVVDQGNHGVHRSDGVVVAQHLVEGASVAHLPVRSPAQLSAKVINGWQACQARNRTRNVPGEAYQWKQLHDRIVGGDELDAHNLLDAALAYAQAPRAGRSVAADLVHDPLPAAHGPLRYLHLGRHSALAKIAASLGAASAPAWSAPTTSGRAFDLAPTLDLCAKLGARDAIVMAGDATWSHALSQLQPALAQHVPSEDRPFPHVNLLFAPDLPFELFDVVSTSADPQLIDCIATWPAEAMGAAALETQLATWYQNGWQPDLRRTMNFRALSNYRKIRRGALVLVQVDKARPDHAVAVRAALCAIDSQPLAWVDPAPALIAHPLQTLNLGEPAVAVASIAAPVQAPVAVVAPVAPTPRSVLICGAGRSGTSCLAGMFGPGTHRHGADLYEPSPSNPKGFFENRQVNDLNESIMMMSAVAHVGADGTRALLQGFTPGQLWLARFPDAMPARWNADQSRDIAQAISPAPFCLKDPRFSITAPAWLEQVPDAALLSIHRAPAVTAESVLRECRSSTYLRDFRISVADAFAVWSQTYRRIVKLYRTGTDVVFLRYEDLFDADRLALLERHVRAPLQQQFAERSLNRTQADVPADAECKALHALLDTLSATTFADERARDYDAIDRFLAAWPDRDGPGAGARSAHAAIANAAA